MKYISNKIHLVITLIMIIVFVIISGLNFISFNKFMKEDVENISKLAASNIYSKIQNEIIKPIVASLTMANDNFLIEWVQDENRKQEEVVKYLDGIKSIYNYDTAFLVLEKSKLYYTENGILKTVSNTSEIDVWYYDFLAIEDLYEVNMDIDEDNDFDLTFFVNCKIFSESDQLLGVIGVGVKTNKLQQLLNEFSNEYDLATYVIDENGIIQAHSSDDDLVGSNAFEKSVLKDHRDSIINEKINLQSIKQNIKGDDRLIISKYMQELEWYLIVEKDVLIRESLYKQVINNFIAIFVAYFLVLLIVNYIIKVYESKLLYVANTDHLTKISNRRMFDQQLGKAFTLAQKGNNNFSLALFDIDNFKKINDKHGHVFADNILALIANESFEYCQTDNVTIYRTGGDEFVLLLSMEPKEALLQVEGFLKMFNEIEDIKKNNITISMGLAHYTQQVRKPIMLVARADKAMYQSKVKGKNTYEVFAELDKQ